MIDLESLLRTETKDYEASTKRIAEEGNARLLHAAMGLSTESSEVLDILKKHLFYGKDLDTAHLKEEVGDVLWYMAIILDKFGWSIDEIAKETQEKLSKRYKNGFTSHEAIHRV